MWEDVHRAWKGPNPNNNLYIAKLSDGILKQDSTVASQKTTQPETVNA